MILNRPEKLRCSSEEVPISFSLLSVLVQSGIWPLACEIAGGASRGGSQHLYLPLPQLSSPSPSLSLPPLIKDLRPFFSGAALTDGSECMHYGRRADDTR